MNKDNYYTPDQNIDADLQKEIDEALGGASIEELLEAEIKPQRRSESGSELRKGIVIAIHGDDIFVDVGGRSEGLLPASQFHDEPLPEEGDEIEVMIDGYEDGMLRLNREGAIEAATWDTLERGQIVEGMVTGHNKGGLELKINGIRAFMPISQIELGRVEETVGYLSRKLQCEVIEVKRSEKNVVVSRRALLERDAEKNAESFWTDLHEGKIVQGTVRNIMPYGAFVELMPGVDGLLHIKDMAHSHVEKAEDIVHAGQEVEVRVISLDREAKKIGLGLKQIQADPWDQVEAKYPVGTPCTGRITRLAEFGAFIEIEEGIEGLIPISEMSFRRIGHPKEIVAAGDTVHVVVINVDMDRHRIGLSLKKAGDDPWQGASVRWAVDSMAEGTVTRVADFGAFVELGAGVEGLVHISQLSDRRVGSPHEVVREGQTVKVRILEVDEERRRISLSMKTASSGDSSVAAEGTMEDLKAIQEKHAQQQDTKKKKNLKGGLEGGSASTSFGELRMG